jgi:methionyl-tRNA synthetase
MVTPVQLGLASDLDSVPHIGHLYTLVTTDIFSRHAKLAQPDRIVHFLTGTDEHGLKIQRAAEAANLEPREFCDRISDRFRVCSFTHPCIPAY